MPRAPRGERRPSGATENAMRPQGSTCSEASEGYHEPRPLSPAQQLGKLGGVARARKRTKERRQEIARKAAAKRWAAAGTSRAS